MTIWFSLMVESGNISDEEIYKSCVKKREEEGTTGIGEGIAIPHAKTPVVKEAGLAAMVVKTVWIMIRWTDFLRI